MIQPGLNIAIIGDRGIPARYSGFSTLVEELAVRLVSDHLMNVTVYCRSSYYDEMSPTYKGVKCVYIPAPGGKSFESIIHSNLSILHAIFANYDLVFIVDPGNAPFSLPIVFKRLPMVFHTDGLGWQRQKWSPMQQRYYKWSEKVCARLSSWLVTDSRAMQNYYKEEYQTPSSYIPYSGVVGDEPDATCLQKYGLEKNGYYLVVARVEPENNIDLIIREYRKAKTERPLVVVGGSRYETSYALQIAAESDRKVKCLGSIFESGVLNGLYANCYVYLHGHGVGGTNPSLLRAMQAGAACIPLNIVFHREVVGEDNEFFEIDAGHLAGVINVLDKKPQRVEQLGSNAKKRAESLYRWDAVAASYAELFRKIVTARKFKNAKIGALAGEVYKPESFYKNWCNQEESVICK